MATNLAAQSELVTGKPSGRPFFYAINPLETLHNMTSAMFEATEGLPGSPKINFRVDPQKNGAEVPDIFSIDVAHSSDNPDAWQWQILMRSSSDKATLIDGLLTSSDQSWQMVGIDHQGALRREAHINDGAQELTRFALGLFDQTKPIDKIEELKAARQELGVALAGAESQKRKNGSYKKCSEAKTALAGIGLFSIGIRDTSRVLSGREVTVSFSDIAPALRDPLISEDIVAELSYRPKDFSLGKIGTLVAELNLLSK